MIDQDMSNPEKLQFMQGLSSSLLGQQVSPQAIQGEALQPGMPQTIDEALMVIQQLQAENEALKQQLGMHAQAMSQGSPMPQVTM